MSKETEVSTLLFDVVTSPLEAVTGPGIQRVRIPGKKAILHANTRQVLGVVGSDYRIVTNREALAMAMQVCAKAFPGMPADEWEPTQATAPATLSFASIDIFHRTHILNLLGPDVRTKDDPYTPFVRVTNSFNRLRALRFDFGFIRNHCRNGVIFERDLASVKLTHARGSFDGWDLKISQFSIEEKWQEFTGYVARLRGAAVTPEEAHRLVTGLLNFPAAHKYKTVEQQAERQELNREIGDRIQKYGVSLGSNAYAVFNTLTDFAARPPALKIFNKSRITLEERAGRWLRLVANEAQAGKPIDWNRHLASLSEKVLSLAQRN